jgi:hypothetical protein
MAEGGRCHAQYAEALSANSRRSTTFFHVRQAKFSLSAGELGRDFAPIEERTGVKLSEVLNGLAIGAVCV